MLQNAFAPARPHITISSFILWINIVAVDDSRAFLSNHISHETSIANEAIAFLESPLLWITSVHQSLTVGIASHSSVLISWRPNQFLKANQILMANRHWKRKWAVVSCTWLQSLQRPQFCQLLRASLSAVETQFWSTNQANILHFDGAQGLVTNQCSSLLSQEHPFYTGMFTPSFTVNMLV